jgi:hypothetical protein
VSVDTNESQVRNQVGPSRPRGRSYTDSRLFSPKFCKAQGWRLVALIQAPLSPGTGRDAQPPSALSIHDRPMSLNARSCTAE